MFDIAPTEFLLVAVVALVVIGPKDLPRAMRFVGQWVGRARSMARQFRSGIDEMIRQAELDEMEKKWAAENARIMREHPASDVPAADHGVDAPPAAGAPPVMTPLPAPPPSAAAPQPADDAASRAAPPLP